MRSIRIGIAILLGLGAAATLRAQTEAATLRGVAHDTSEAIVPGAAVTLTSIDQGRSWNASTNDRGEYLVEDDRRFFDGDQRGYGGGIAPAANTNNNNLRLNRSLTLLDIAHRVVANYQ